MDSSNEILFNSPALHSLKRAQLLLLCKRYNIKQSGKNEDLVVRLRHYAHDLLDQTSQVSAPVINVVTAATQGEPEFHVRTSQQWELVEGDGQEEDNSTVADKRTRTLSIRSIGGMSTKSGTSVSSSLMSIANSLKRAGSKSSKFSTTRSTNSMSTTSSIVRQPLSHLFPSVPTTTAPMAPPTETSSLETKVDDSMVESSVAETKISDDLDRPIIDGKVDGTTLNKDQTTVRLVTPVAVRLRSNASHPTNSFPTPVLKPFHLALPTEPLPTHPNEDIGRAFLDMDARSFTETMKSGAESADVSVDQITLNPAITVDSCITPTRSSPATISKAYDGLQAPSSGPFIFGSPANAVSNAQFGQAAAAILEEMNKRLGVDANSSAAAKIGADGRFEFGEATPTRPGTLIGAGKKDEGGRYGKVHEKVFDKMESIADYHSTRGARSPVKPTTSLAGTKRKSTYHQDEPLQGRRIICLDDPKDKTMAPPAPKRQKVDGADLARMEKASIKSSIAHVKEDDANLKKLAGAKERRRNSMGRRSSAAGTNARRKSVAQAKAAPSSRLGLLRGAAKVMKNIISSVSNPAPVPSNNAKAPMATASVKPVPMAATTAVSITKTENAAASTSTKPITGAASIAPKAKKPSIPGGPTRPTALVPRASSTVTSTRNASASTSRTTASSLAPKAANAQRVVRGSNAASARGKLPVFPEPATDGDINLAAIPGARASSRMSVVTNASSRRSSNMSTSTTGVAKKPVTARTTSGSTLAPTVASQSRRASKNVAATSSVNSKMSLDSVPEKKATEKAVRDLDFEPAMPGDEDEGSRPSSPLPAPPASLSSRPLQKRTPLEPTQPTATAETTGSMGKKPRISRSKVIAKVHASREGQKPKTPVGSTSRARKSIGVTAKAKMMGSEGAKGRASAAADAAKRKARVSEAAARRRTLAQAKA